jgi:hypothetical protein
MGFSSPRTGFIYDCILGFSYRQLRAYWGQYPVEIRDAVETWFDQASDLLQPFPKRTETRTLALTSTRREAQGGLPDHVTCAYLLFMHVSVYDRP